MCLDDRWRGRHQGSEDRWEAMRALSSRPFCSCDSRQVSLGDLSAGYRDTTLRSLSMSFLWLQAVVGIIGAKSRNALRNNSRCTWRDREGARNVYNTAIRRVLSPLRLCGSVTADVHGCPRGVAPLRPPLAIRDYPVVHTGGATPQSPHHATGCAAHPAILFSPPGNGFSSLNARWKPLI